MLEEVIFSGLRADTTLAAARLVAISIRRGALDVAGVADGDEHFGVRDQVLELDLVHLVHDLRAAIIAVGFVDFAKLGGDDLLEFLFTRQNFLEFGDEFANGLQFLENFVNGELREAVELQFEDGVNLRIAEAEIVGTPRGFNFRRTCEFVFASVELHTLKLLGLAVLGDRDVLLGKILEQVFLGLDAAAAATNDADDVVQMI